MSIECGICEESVHMGHAETCPKHPNNRKTIIDEIDARFKCVSSLVQNTEVTVTHAEWQQIKESIKPKVVEIPQPKHIQYYGQKITVPHGFEWIATDITGKVCIFTDEPEQDHRFAVWDIAEGDYLVCTSIPMENVNWLETKQRIE